jgi:hypothetical protein
MPCRTVAFSERVSHRFRSDHRQRVKFANGLVAEFDLEQERYRVMGTEEFIREWEDPPDCSHIRVLPSQAKHREIEMLSSMTLTAQSVAVTLSDDARITVTRGDRVIWESSRKHAPHFAVASGGGEPRVLMLYDATETAGADWSEGAFQGKALRLSGYPDTDLALELVLAMDADTDELLVQIAQVGGSDTVTRMDHLYRFAKRVSEGGYLVLSHGSGYLIPADCPDELPGKGFQGGTIGGRWSLPLFGVVKGNESLVAIVDTWWDCDVHGNHIPGDFSELDFRWAPSLGKLGYPRRVRYRFAQGLDYVGMAKLYRAEARAQGLVRTLKEKTAESPQIQRYLEGVLVRWAPWNPAQISAVLQQLQKLRDRGLQLNLFFPKWPSQGYSDERSTAQTSDGIWQGYIHPDPVPGGWTAIAEFNRKARDIGCLIQGFINPMTQKEGAPGYDPALWPLQADGAPHQYWLSIQGAPERNQRALASLPEHGVHMDVLYYDGYSAASHPVEDFNPAHPCTLRDVYEGQNRCFADSRRAGIMPGAELARFWAMRDCDYWFYTDWSSDRLFNTENKGCPGPVGVPVPLFELVFHDCYLAGFSGGGYKLYHPGFDWWDDQHPRLYELLFVAAPCHNWLPEGAFPYDRIDAPEAETRWAWLRKMAALCVATKHAEMVSHEFLSDGYQRRRVKFANGVVAEFDMAHDRYKVTGAEGFTGEWEPAPQL